MVERARGRLSPDDWTAAALTALTEGGLGAVAIEPLAVRLGTTKGSGYWHFANRAALIEATLQRWEREHTEQVIIATEQTDADPLARLRSLMHAVVGRTGPQSTELSLLAHADDPMVGPVLNRVTERRISYLTSLFRQLGFDPDDAGDRALLAYSTYLGHSQLARTAPATTPVGDARTVYLDSILAVLVSPVAPTSPASPTSPTSPGSPGSSPSG